MVESVAQFADQYIATFTRGSNRSLGLTYPSTGSQRQPT